MLNISEIFLSVQGEGPNTGLPSIFIRTQGCNIGCNFCDTPYTHDGTEKGKKMSIEEILQEIKQYLPVKHIVLTGGEPLLQKDVKELIEALLKDDYSIEIETAGMVEDAYLNNKVQYNISPKLSSCKPKIAADDNVLVKFFKVYNKATKNIVLKFVIGSEEDWIEAKELIGYIELKANNFMLGFNIDEFLYFMPEGKEEESLKKNSKFIIEKIVKERPKSHLSARVHVHIFGPKRGV